jgi:hypothetical protein
LKLGGFDLPHVLGFPVFRMGGHTVACGIGEKDELVRTLDELDKPVPK